MIMKREALYVKASVDAVLQAFWLARMGRQIPSFGASLLSFQIELGIRMHKYRHFLLPLIAATSFSAANAQPSTPAPKPMQQTPSPQPQIPPEVLRYINGATADSHQFDFLVGDWDVQATRFKEDGSTLFQYKAAWNAKLLNDGRMLMDDFKALSPTGQPVSSFVTLRTFSDATKRWEIVGLSAFQPNTISEWYGHSQSGEMLLVAKGRAPNGAFVQTRIRFFDIKANAFSWESHLSSDDGKTWLKTASLSAARVAS